MANTLHNARLRRKVAAWAQTMIIWWATGFAIGITLDYVLWRLSYNYLYSPYQFSRRFCMLALAIASIVAAFASTGMKPPVRLLPTLQAIAVCTLLTIAVSIGWATTASTICLERPPQIDRYLAPIRRVRFCDGLWRGAACGYGIGSLMALIWFKRIRNVIMDHV